MQKVSFHPNKAFWRLSLTSGTSHKFELWANCLARLDILSYSAPAIVTLQFPACFTRVPLWQLANREAPLFAHYLSFLHITWVFFTLSHTQLLHNSHLDTGHLIAKIQANLARNKANHDWINSTLQVFYFILFFSCTLICWFSWRYNFLFISNKWYQTICFLSCNF